MGSKKTRKAKASEIGRVKPIMFTPKHEIGDKVYFIHPITLDIRSAVIQERTYYEYEQDLEDNEFNREADTLLVINADILRGYTVKYHFNFQDEPILQEDVFNSPRELCNALLVKYQTNMDV